MEYLGLSRRRHKGLLSLELCWGCLDWLCRLGCRLTGLCRLALCPSLRGQQSSRSRQGRLTTGHCFTHCTCHKHLAFLPSNPKRWQGSRSRHCLTHCIYYRHLAFCAGPMLTFLEEDFHERLSPFHADRGEDMHYESAGRSCHQTCSHVSNGAMHLRSIS